MISMTALFASCAVALAGQPSPASTPPGEPSTPDADAAAVAISEFESFVMDAGFESDDEVGPDEFRADDPPSACLGIVPALFADTPGERRARDASPTSFRRTTSTGCPETRTDTQDALHIVVDALT